MGLVAPEWSLFCDVSDGRVEDALGRYLMLLKCGSMLACRAFSSQTEAMCWLTEPRMKEAVSNARQDGASFAHDTGGWLAVFFASSCAAFAVEPNGLRRALSMMAPTSAGLTLLCRFETADFALEWLAGGAPRAAFDVMNSSSLDLPPQASARDVASALSPPFSVLSRNRLPQQTGTGSHRLGGQVNRCGRVASDPKSNAVAAYRGAGGGPGREWVRDVNHATCSSLESLPPQVASDLASAQSLCFRVLGADAYPAEHSSDSRAISVGLRGDAADPRDHALSKRRNALLPGEPNDDLNPPVSGGDCTDGMLSRASLERMRIESKAYYDTYFAAMAGQVGKKHPLYSNSMPLKVASKGSPSGALGPQVTSFYSLAGAPAKPSCSSLSLSRYGPGGDLFSPLAKQRASCQWGRRPAGGQG